MHGYRFTSSIEPCVLDDFNDYFAEYLRSGDEFYIRSFLHRYENILNSRAFTFIEDNGIESDRLCDLKQIFCEVLWQELKAYTSDDEIPLLQKIKWKVRRAWTEYLRQYCMATSFGNANHYNEVRRIMRIYSECEFTMSYDEILNKISDMLGIEKQKANAYILDALSGRYADEYSLELDEVTPSHNDFVYDDFSVQENHRALLQAYKKLTITEKKIISLSFGINLETAEESMPKTDNDISFLLGLTASGVNKKKKHALKKMKSVLVGMGFSSQDLN